MPPKFFKKKFSGKTSANIKVRNEYATYLIIVESPSKCEKIESYLGDNYCCIASKGHIRDIDGLKSIDTKNTFQPAFSIISEKKGHIEEMKKIIKITKTVELNRFAYQAPHCGNAPIPINDNALRRND